MGAKVAFIVGAFVVMLVAAIALMVRFTGSRPAADAAPIAAAMPAATPGLVVPVAGVPPAQVVDTWGQSRAGGARAHEGTDIVAPPGTPVLAAAPGVIEKLFDSVAGGRTLYVRSPDRGLSFYYAHLAGYAPGVAEGVAVRAGQHIGYVGDTGNAGAGNYHLHFGIARTRPGDRWWQGDPINPHPLLAGTTANR